MNGQLTDYTDSVRQCLLEFDLPTMRKLWKHLAPHFPQPGSDEEMTISMHHARTLSRSLPLRARAYSHAWLTERAFPSGLPDELRPVAERMFPRVADAVGIAVLSIHSSEEPKRLAGEAVRDIMSGVVMDHYSSDRPRDPTRIKTDMLRARSDFWKKALRATIGWRK